MQAFVLAAVALVFTRRLMVRSFTAAIIATIVTAATTAAQIAAPPGSGLRLLRGVVEQEGAEPMPLRRARVVVSAPGLSADPVFTDDRGRFETYVPAARPFSIAVTKAGYARRVVTPQPAAAGEVRVRLPKGAAIGGRVLDRFGDPTQARVLLEGSGVTLAGNTSDLGEYRFGSLAAGRYIVTILGRGGGDSQEIAVAAGQEPALVHMIDAGEILVVGGRPVSQLLRADAPAGVSLNAGIRGQVSWPDGRPVGGVDIVAGWMGNPELPGVFDQTRTTVTDAAGRYEFTDIMPGSYRIVAAKLAASVFDATRDRLPLSVSAGEIATAPDITMTRPAAVTGAVVDEHGEPIEGMSVQLWSRRAGGGRALLLPVNTVREVRTDDRGRYRLFGAPPGAYYIVVSDEPVVSSSPVPVPAPGSAATRVYYPGVSAIAEAVTVHVDAGRETGGADVVFAPRGASVHGFAFEAAGRPLVAPVVLVDSHRSGFPTPALRTAPVTVDGGFTFSNVPPGDYVLQGVVGGSRGRPEQFGMQFVTVSPAGAPPALIRTMPGATLAGRVVLEGDASALPFERFGLSAQPADWDYVSTGSEAPSAIAEEDGSFEMALLFGPMRITGSAPDGWWLKAVHVGGVDATDQPFHFTSGVVPDATAVFADTGASLAGWVVDDSGRPAKSYSVLVFSIDRNRWWAPSGYVMLARPDDAGRFATGTLPPGEYLAAAVDTFDIGSEWLDPEVLASLAPRARRLTLPPNGTITTELELIRRPQ